MAGFGLQTSALAAGGNVAGSPALTANTESYNGTSWTELNNLATARRQLAGNGTGTAGLAYGGTTGSQTNATEEWTVPESISNVSVDVD